MTIAPKGMEPSYHLEYRIAEDSRRSLGHLPYIAWQVWGPLTMVIGGREPFEVTRAGTLAHPDMAPGTVPEVYLPETLEGFMESCWTLALGEGYEVVLAGTGVSVDVSPVEGKGLALRLAVAPGWAEFLEPVEGLPVVPMEDYRAAVRTTAAKLLGEVEGLLPDPSLYKELMAYRAYLQRIGP